MAAGQRKIRVGRVVGDKMDKTVVVAVDTLRRHPLYNKSMKKAVKYKAHDANKESHVGDVVRIVETRPLSRTKRWRVTGVITKARAVEVRPEEIASPIPAAPEPAATTENRT